VSNVELPTWVWDLLADLVDEDAVHPVPPWYDRYDDKLVQWDWCPAVALKRVPDDMLRVAEYIANYRREVKA